MTSIQILVVWLAGCMFPIGVIAFAFAFRTLLGRKENIT